MAVSESTTVMIAGPTPDEVSLVLAGLAYLFRGRATVTARYQTGEDGAATHCADVSIRPEAASVGAGHGLQQ